jgi:hypothetical protein
MIGAYCCDTEAFVNKDIPKCLGDEDKDVTMRLGDTTVNPQDQGS